MTLNKLKENSRKEAEKKIMPILLDKIDEYFPKIRPNGPNKGRGESAVIVGLAFAKFYEVLDTQIEKSYAQALEDVLKIVPKKKHGKLFKPVEVNWEHYFRLGFNRAIATITDGIKKLKEKK